MHSASIWVLLIKQLEDTQIAFILAQKSNKTTHYNVIYLSITEYLVPDLDKVFFWNMCDTQKDAPLEDDIQISCNHIEH